MKYQLNPDLAWTFDQTSSQVLLMRLPLGDPMALTGSAATIFLDLEAGLDPLAAALTRWPEKATEVTEYTNTFLADLERLEILVPPPSTSCYRVLFVCTANICRSAYAAAAAQLSSGSSAIEFGSAGTHALIGQPIDPPMAAELTAPAVSEHRAQQLTQDLVESYDLILAMTPRHRNFVLEEWPQAATKCYLIGQAARALSALPQDLTLPELTRYLWETRSYRTGDAVADPYNLGQAVATNCARDIDQKLSSIITGLKTLAQESQHD